MRREQQTVAKVRSDVQQVLSQPIVSIDVTGRTRTKRTKKYYESIDRFTKAKYCARAYEKTDDVVKVAVAKTNEGIHCQVTLNKEPVGTCKYALKTGFSVSSRHVI